MHTHTHTQILDQVVHVLDVQIIIAIVTFDHTKIRNIYKTTQVSDTQ